MMTRCVPSGHLVTGIRLDHQLLVTGKTGQQRGTTGIRKGRAHSRTTPGHVARRLLLWSVSTRWGNTPEVVLHTLLAVTDMDQTCTRASHARRCAENYREDER
jgi:hypothetical protein